MNYIIIELQKTGSSVAVVPPKTFSDKSTAEQAYHTALAAAAVSSVEVHSVVMLRDNGVTVKSERYVHEQPAA